MEPIFRHTVRVQDEDGSVYDVAVHGEERSDGTWAGWLEFVAEDSGVTLRTGEETSQPTRAALEYWASGLEPIYLDGAFDRACGRLPSGSLQTVAPGRQSVPSAPDRGPSGAPRTPRSRSGST